MSKKLKRETEQAVVGGVIAGLAAYFKQDPVFFRIAAITLLIFTGIFPGLFVYLIAWIIVPRKNDVEYTVLD